MYDETGKITGIIGTSHDITDLKQAEKKIQQSEIIYLTIFESTSAPTIILDEGMTILLANSASENLLGYSKEDREGRRSGRGSAPDNYEFGLIDKSGNLHDIYLTVQMIPGTKKERGITAGKPAS